MKNFKFYLQLIVGVILMGIATSQFFHFFGSSLWGAVVAFLAGFALALRRCLVERRGGLLVGVTLLVLAVFSAWNANQQADRAAAVDADKIRQAQRAGAYAGERTHRSYQKSFSIFYPALALIGAGVFFGVFSRYLYRPGAEKNPPGEGDVFEAAPMESLLRPTPPAAAFGRVEPPGSPALPSFPRPPSVSSKPRLQRDVSDRAQAKPARSPASPRNRARAAAPPGPWSRLLLLGVSALLAVGIGLLPGIRESGRRTEVILTVLILGCVSTGIISERTMIKIFPWKTK